MSEQSTAPGAAPTAPAGGHVRVLLELDVVGDAITGSVSSESGAPRPFSGWMELVARIENIRATVAAAGHAGSGAA